MLKLVIFFGIAVAACYGNSASEEEGELFEGDMVLDPIQMSAYHDMSAFGARKTGHWKDSRGRTQTIYYYISSTISSSGRSAVYSAISHIKSRTCIRFSKRTSKPRSGYYIYFRASSSSCSSPVGRRSGGNTIKLKTSCYNKGNIAHEILHSLGFYHEQSRPDRDSYVTIYKHNVKSDHEHNFQKRLYSEVDSLAPISEIMRCVVCVDKIGHKYDYDSIMHYRGTSFSRNGDYTIKTKYSSDQRRIGQRNGLSSGDIAQIKTMYC